MDIGLKIISEKDPILRELYAQGCDVSVNKIYRKIELRNNDGMKSIPMDDFDIIFASMTTKTGILPDGSRYTWISEGDGSAQRFRDFISKYPVQRNSEH